MSIFDGLEGVVPKQEVAEAQKEPQFDAEYFKNTFGVEVPDIESAKGIFEKASKFDEVFNERETYATRIAELEALESKVDPLSYFSSEDAFVREQFILKNKDIDANVLNVVSNLSPSKVGGLSDFEAVKLKMFIDNPDLEGGQEGVVELLADRYGVTVEELSEGDLSGVVKNKLKLDGKQAKEGLNKLYEGIDIPKKVDVNQVRTEVKTAWEAPLKEIVKGIDKISIAEGLDFVVTDDMKEGLYDEYLQSLGNSMTKPSVDIGKQIAGEMRKALLIDNIDKLAQFIDKQSEEKWKAHFKAQVHNPNPLNESPKGEGKTNAAQDWLNRQ